MTVLRMEEMERPVPNLRGSRRFRYSVYGVWAYMHWSDPCHLGQQSPALIRPVIAELPIFDIVINVCRITRLAEHGPNIFRLTSQEHDFTPIRPRSQNPNIFEDFNSDSGQNWPKQSTPTDSGSDPTRFCSHAVTGRVYFPVSSSRVSINGKKTVLPLKPRQHSPAGSQARLPSRRVSRRAASRGVAMATDRGDANSDTHRVCSRRSSNLLQAPLTSSRFKKSFPSLLQAPPSSS